MFAAQAVHFTRELFAKLVEQVPLQQLLFERLQDSRLDLVTPDGEVVVAGAFLASAEACETVAAGHDEPGTADAAFRQP